MFRFVCAFFPGVFLSSRVTGACPVTTDLTMLLVDVRTTTTTATYDMRTLLCELMREQPTNHGAKLVSIHLLIVVLFLSGLGCGPTKQQYIH